MSKSVAQVFGKRKHALPASCDELVLPMAKIGVEVEVENIPESIDVPVFWRTHGDGSLRNGIEFVTDGGLVGKDLTDGVRILCKYLTDKKFSEGIPRAGIHIHMDVTDMNDRHDKELLFLISAYILAEDIFFKFAGEWRARTGYCEPLYFARGDFASLRSLLCNWDKMTEENLKQLLIGADSGDGRYLSKYQAVNLLPMTTFGTIEFRHLPTTFDPQRIITWINMILSLKRFAHSLDEEADIPRMFSVIRPRPFFERVFGRVYPEIENLIDEIKVWDRLDALQTLMHTGQGYGWSRPSNQLLLEKVSKVPKPEPKAKAKKTVAQILAEEQEFIRQVNQLPQEPLNARIRRMGFDANILDDPIAFNHDDP